MIQITCKRCQTEFYTASPDYIRNCPYCNFQLGSSAIPESRKEERSEISKNCVLVKGSIRLDARATDISPKGVGLKINEAVPLDIDDTIHIIIKDLDIDSIARVVWIKRAQDSKTQTGLRFN